MEDLSLYIHIPFCVRKCSYCDFLSGPAGEREQRDYKDALIREIRAADVLHGFSRDRFRADTVFLGGGTPSVLPPSFIGEILDAVRETFVLAEDAEISMEMNPETVTGASLAACREAGVGRVSFGVQSLDDRELRLLGRIHTADRARQAFREAREAGFANINVDLMTAIPGQTLKSLERTLEEVIAWGPEHISAYSLIIEEGTPFASMDLPDLPDEEEDRRMYHYLGRRLKEAGYGRYEISNYARPGFACRHNTGYWTGHAYLGLGTGAASLAGGDRFSNVRSLRAYLAALEKDPLPFSCEEERTSLTREDRMSEFMFLGLRLCRGVSERDFEERFHRSLMEVFGPEISRHLSEGLLVREGDRIRLSERGLDLANYVMSDFV